MKKTIYTNEHKRMVAALREARRKAKLKTNIA